MHIRLPTYIDLYDELLKRGYEGKCNLPLHDECCPYGLRVKILVLREIPSQENLEQEQELESRLMWMMEQDKLEVYKTFFDGAFWAVPFRHAADLMTHDGLDTFVSYLRNCLAIGPLDDVLRKMRNDVEYTTYADEVFDADKRTRISKKEANPRQTKIGKGSQSGKRPRKAL